MLSWLSGNLSLDLEIHNKYTCTFESLLYIYVGSYMHLISAWLVEAENLDWCLFRVSDQRLIKSFVKSCPKFQLDMLLKLHLAYLPNFFSIWIRVLNHNKYVEIKQFSKEDIKQNNILLIKFLVYQWDPRHLQGGRVVYIFIYTLYSCSI